MLLENATRVAREPIQRTSFTLDGDSRDVLFQHPPSSRLSLTTRMPAEARQLIVSPAIDPRVTPGCGDGVSFRIELDDPAKGGPQTVYERYIDPKAAPAAQHWSEDTVDLKAYAGKQVHLLLSTTGGPKGDTACDWAGWGDLKFAATSAKGVPGRSENPFRLAFHDAVDVYEYPFSLPRASVFSRAIVVSSPEAALEALRKPEFDPWRQVVLEAPSADTVTVPQQPAEIAKPARIESYDTEHVVVQAETDRPGWLLLTDSNYPGWKAYVDGQPAPILKANFLFRGVRLLRGSHRVEFRYSPASYAAGYTISLCSAILAGAWIYRDRRRKITPQPRERAVKVA